MTTERRYTLTSLAAGLILIAGLAALFISRFLHHHHAYSFVTYRYAANLRDGLGFVYNPGQAVMHAASSPLYAYLLNSTTAFTNDIPLLGNIISAISIILGGMAMYGLTYHNEHKIAAPIAAGIYMGFPLLWASLGIDASLWMGLSLIAAYCYTRQWGIPSALILALATFTRPEVLTLGLALITVSILENRPVRLLVIGSYAVPVIIMLIWGLSAFDVGGPVPFLPPSWMASFLPDVLAANSIPALGLLAVGVVSWSWLWVVVVVLSIPGLVHLREHHGSLLIGTWAVLHIIILAIVRVTVYSWTLAPLIPAFAVLAGLGVEWLSQRLDDVRLKIAIVSISALLIVGAVIQSYVRIDPAATSSALIPAPVERNVVEAAAWIQSNTAADTVMAATFDDGLAYIADRSLLDYRGRLQSDLLAALRRDDHQWWLGEYTPEIVILKESEYQSLNGYALASDGWFNATYTQVMRFDTAPGQEEPVIIMQRTVTPRPFTNLFSGMVTYQEGLTLNNIAVDFSLDPLEGGRAGRVRLEWLLREHIEQPQYVSIRIMARGGTTQAALAGRPVDFSDWPQNRLLTSYHTIDIADALTAGVYDLEVGIGPDPFNLTWHPVTQAKIPFQTDIFVGGVTGTQADFGDIVLLGYRLVRTEEGMLDIALMWQAQGLMIVDYTILIQVRSENGAVLTQAHLQPHEGRYPTSIWSAGEKVPDSYQLDTADLPPGNYPVYVGLVAPDGERILTTDNQDAVLVGFLIIPSDN